ncbi:hypothetical protein WIX39_025965 [Variovorax sp. AB1(2024)]|uniref:hypothetical protein n=1 Tax=Variovorax sp. AB1(2024) TaxID=3132214 RepID=UPI0030A34CA1
MGIAGIYKQWTSPDGEKLFSFTMLAVNADGHPYHPERRRRRRPSRPPATTTPHRQRHWTHRNSARKAVDSLTAIDEVCFDSK